MRYNHSSALKRAAAAAPAAALRFTMAESSSGESMYGLAGRDVPALGAPSSTRTTAGSVLARR